MYDYELENEDKDLKKVGLELMFMTPVDIVKKKLVILKDAGVVSVKGINPKYWKFDDYSFQRMDEDDDVYKLLCSFDDVDFDKYFSY